MEGNNQKKWINGPKVAAYGGTEDSVLSVVFVYGHGCKDVNVKHNPNVHRTNEWMNRTRSAHLVGYDSSVKRNDVQTCSTTWVNLETIVLSGGSQS